MNIKSRIKSMEKQAGISNSEYCQCYGKEALKWEVMPINMDEWNRRFDAGEEAMTRLPDKCEECLKPVDKRFIEITFEEAQATVKARLDEIAERVAQRAG